MGYLDCVTYWTAFFVTALPVTLTIVTYLLHTVTIYLRQNRIFLYMITRPPLSPSPKGDKNWISEYTVPAWKGININRWIRWRLTLVSSFTGKKKNNNISIILNMPTKKPNLLYNSIRLILWEFKFLVVELSVIPWYYIFKNTGHREKETFSQ